MRSQLVLGGKFKVYEDGRVNSVFDGTEGPAKTYRTSRGYRYLAVKWYENGKQKSAYVHRLVASAFVDNPNNYPQVNHKDGNTSNNRADNLEWVTPGQNIRHAYDTGLSNRMAYGEPCKRCGDFTLAKDQICTRCKHAIQTEENQMRVQEERSSRYKKVDLSICSASEKNYVKLAADGISIPQIADIYGVSRQCVGAALLNAEKKTICGVAIPKAVQNEQIRLQNKVSRSQKRYEDAKSKAENLKQEYELALRQQEEYEKYVSSKYPSKG